MDHVQDSFLIKDKDKIRSQPCLGTRDWSYLCMRRWEEAVAEAGQAAESRRRLQQLRPAHSSAKVAQFDEMTGHS